MNRLPGLLLCLSSSILACSSRQTSPDLPLQAAPDPERVFNYASGTTRYIQTSLRDIEQEVSGQVTSSRTVLRYHLTTDIEDRNGAMVVHFTVDSIADAEAPGYTPSVRRDATGMSFQGTFTQTGRITDLNTGTRSSPLIARLTTLISQFFPLIPAGGPAPGTEWVDTTETTTDDGSTRIVTTMINTNVAGSWRDDGTGMPISWRMTYTFSGQGEQLGQNFTLEGTGLRSGEHLLSADGIYLETTAVDSSEASVLLPTIGITVPVVQTGVDTVRILR